MKKWLASVVLTLILLGVVAGERVEAIEGISSDCGILMEQTTGRVLYEKCADEQMYVASITKIMTALIAIEHISLEELVEILEEDLYQIGSALYMIRGDQMVLIDLLYGLMLRSGNDAAWAIARHVGGGDVAVFVEMMNEKAAEIGMDSTLFQNPSGLDETTYNVSTARDMALLQRYAMNNPIYREISGTSVHRATSAGGRQFVWNNKHRLVRGRYEHTISGKTGFTEAARRTLVSSAAQNGVELIVVTLRGGDDWNDHISLFEYGFDRFELKQVTEAGELDFIDHEIREMTGFDRLFVREERHVVVRDNEEIRTHLVMGDQEETGAVGQLEILVGDQLIDSVAVYAMEEISTEDATWFERVLNWLSGR